MRTLAQVLDKRFLLIPHVLIFILLTVLEILSAKAVKSNKNALASLTDRLKLIGSVFFFWWNLMLMSEMRIGIFSVSLFVCLCVLFFIIYLKRKKSEPSV